MDYNSKTYALRKRGYKGHIKKIIEFLAPRREDKILEVGCARGVVVKAVQDIAPNTHGVDISKEAILHGVTKNLAAMSAEQLKFEDESFDKVYSFHTIEHVPAIKKALREMARVLRSGGKLMLVYPAEPIRGLFSVGASLLIFKNPLRSREIHVHKLTPKKVQGLLEGTRLSHVTSKFTLAGGPQFFSVFQKKA